MKRFSAYENERRQQNLCENFAPNVKVYNSYHSAVKLIGCF